MSFPVLLIRIEENMPQAPVLTYAQLHKDQALYTAQQRASTEPFESLLILLEGAGFRNENSGIRMQELLSQPLEEPIQIPYQGVEYHVARVSYPTNQQFSRFTIIPKT